MEPSELLGAIAAKLDALGIEYLTTGSMASIVYGEPRLTNDIDLVVRIHAEDADRLCAAFPETDFYVSRESAREAVACGSQFNVIHPASGLKIDFMVAAADDFNRSRFERGRSIEIVPGITVRFASPEDVIIRKLQYFQEGGSDKHLRDIRGILRLCDDPVDAAYIERWIDRFGVRAQWEQVNRE